MNRLKDRLFPPAWTAGHFPWQNRSNRQNQQNQPKWKIILCHVYRAALPAAAGLGLGVLLLPLAVGPYAEEIFYGYLENWETVVLNIVPAALLVLLACAATGRAWAGYLLGGAAAFALSLGNFFKIQFRDDPLYFEDLFTLREAGAMADSGHYDLFVTEQMAAAAAALVLGALLLRLLAGGRTRGWKPRLAVLGAAVLGAAAVTPLYLDDELYENAGSYEYLEQMGETQNYIAHGFFYPFIHSIAAFAELPPAGYTAAKAEALLSAYTDADIPEDRKISVIVIMREAYADFSRYGVRGLDTDGYELYHQMEKESYTGNLVTNIFAGGTVDTERCVLTGGYKARSFRSNVNSYAWYLREQGYTAEGAHPYHKWFYNRQNINARMGLENYRFLEGDFENLSGALYPEDSVLLPEIYADFVKNKSTGKPYFSFSVNVQSHGPYATWDMGAEELLNGSRYSVECRKAVTNYLNVIWETDRALADLMEKLRGDTDPVILVTFGDHLPWMGDGKAFYEEMGVNLDLSTEEGFFTHYSTRYLIWANDAAKKIIGGSVTGEGPSVSPCYLMNLVFRQAGWEGPAFTQAMDDFMEIFPVVSIKNRYVADGVLTDAIPESRQREFRNFLYLQRYWGHEFLY